MTLPYLPGNESFFFFVQPLAHIRRLACPSLVWCDIPKASLMAEKEIPDHLVGSNVNLRGASGPAPACTKRFISNELHEKTSHCICTLEYFLDS